jgi:hypothetical protein
LWTPFRGLFLENTARLDAQLNTLGLGLETGTDSLDSDLFTSLCLLRLLDAQANGSMRLDAQAAQAYTNLVAGQQQDLEALGARVKPDVEAALQAAGDWLVRETEIQSFESLAAAVDMKQIVYHILPSTHFAKQTIRGALPRSLITLAMLGPDRYAIKWRWHALLLRQMSECARRNLAARNPAGVRMYIPLYILLCHAGAPITVFRPGAETHRTSGAIIYHFTDAYDEDLPDQGMFSRESHLAQALELAYLLEKLGVTDFDPVRHMIMLPFDLVVDNAPGRPYSIVIQQEGFSGYLDSLARRGVPSAVETAPPKGGL